MRRGVVNRRRWNGRVSTVPKRLSGDLADRYRLDSEPGGDRFLSEIKTTAKLQHPHILPLLDSGSADGLLYYVMPLVTGETLRARLERERQLPIDDAVLIAREVADAVRAGAR